MTRVLVHLVLHCVFSTRIEPLKVTRSACVCAHARNMSFTACNAHLRCANQVIVRILLLPSENTMNAPNVHKCTSARSPSMAKRTLRMAFMACQGSKVKLWGVPVPDQARPTQCALFGPKVKGQKVCQNLPRTNYLPLLPQGSLWAKNRPTQRMKKIPFHAKWRWDDAHAKLSGNLTDLVTEQELRRQHLT